MAILTHSERMAALTNQSPFAMTAVARREESFVLVDEIKSAIAGGASFTNPYASELFTSMRDRLAKYGPNTHVSPDQLRGLRKISQRMKGKKK